VFQIPELASEFRAYNNDNDNNLCYYFDLVAISVVRAGVLNSEGAPHPFEFVLHLSFVAFEIWELALKFRTRCEIGFSIFQSGECWQIGSVGPC